MVKNKERGEMLVGAIGALRTFTRDDGEIELEKQRFHLDWVIRQGITTGNGCIMVAAGGSEGYFMNDTEWKAQVSMAAETADGRVPIIAGIFDLSAREAVKKAKFAAEAGCDFVQIAPPHYMVPTDSEVIEHFRWINDSVDIGIFAYNTPWAQPRPGYDFTETVLEEFASMEQVTGVKWSSYNQEHYLKMARMFTPRLNFICNQVTRVLSMPMKLGFKGFINSDGLAAPRFVLHLWELWQKRDYDEFDNVILRTYVDPFLRVNQPEDITWKSMGEGPYVRLGMEALGMRMGPAFPAQQPLSEDSVRQRVEGFKRSGLLDWVDWNEELWKQHKAKM
jgi:4-hydroxy-tetrahydrodipicolinate synthase